MKVLKLEVKYDGNYAQEEGYMILPTEINGTLFEKQPLNETLVEVVDLGELEGKHSECFGDLEIVVIETDELNTIELQDLVENSNTSLFGPYLEVLEDNFVIDEENKVETEQILEKYGLECDSFLKSVTIHHYLIQELSKELKRTSLLGILEDDLEKAVKLLKENGIEVVKM